MKKTLVALIAALTLACQGSTPTSSAPVADTTCVPFPGGLATVIPGAFSNTITFPGHPFEVFWPIKNGNPDPEGPCRYSKVFNVPLSGTYKGAWVFFGVDRGGIVESHITVQDNVGRILFARSEHKEELSHYDAYRYYEFTPPATFTSLSIHILGYVTDPPNRTRIHWEVAFEKQ